MLSPRAWKPSINWPICGVSVAANQGFLLAEPLRPDAVEAFLTRHGRRGTQGSDHRPRVAHRLKPNGMGWASVGVLLETRRRFAARSALGPEQGVATAPARPRVVPIGLRPRLAEDDRRTLNRSDATMADQLLAELPEHLATGAIAEIYDEIRRFSGVPYVSSLQRYLATMPGVLKWAWAAVRPAMVSGVIPETGWRLAGEVRLAPLPPASPAERAGWKLDMGGYTTIGAIADNFVRVSPVNLMTGACCACC